MPIRIAAASSDGKVINRHFGVAEQFLIFDIDKNGWTFIERRENTPPCNNREHDDDRLTDAIKNITDCSLVLVSRIGGGALSALALNNIDAVEFSGLIEEALDKLKKSQYIIRRNK